MSATRGRSSPRSTDAVATAEGAHMSFLLPSRRVVMGHEGEHVGDRLELLAHPGHHVLDAPGDTLPGRVGAGSQLDDERAGRVQPAGVVVGFVCHAARRYPE